MHTLASVAASHPCQAKNSSLCSHLISLCHPSPVFKCGGGARNSNTTSSKKTQTREAKDKRRRRVQQMHLRCMCGHVYLCALAETWECACGSVNVKVWCHCLHPPVGLLDKKSISSFAPQEPNRTRLRDNRRPVMSPDINGGSLTEMSGCDGSILKHRREAGVTWWGEGCWAIRDMSHIGHAGWFTIKIYYIPWGWNSHYLMLTCTGPPLNL